MGTWTLGADNATIRNVPEPGPGPIQSRRPIPQLSRINAIRFDGKSIYHGVTFKAERRLRDNFAFNVSYTLSTLEGRCVEPWRHGIGSQRSAKRAEHLRRDRRVGALELRSPASVRRERRLQFPFFAGAGGSRKPRFGGWRINAILTAQSGAPFTVNLGVDRANIGAGPAQRPDQLQDPNLPGGERTPDRWFDTVGVCAARAVHLRKRAAEQRAWAGICERRSRPREDMDPSRALADGVPLGDLQPLQPGQLRSSEPHLRHAELRPYLQRQKSSRDAVWPPRRF